MKKVFLGLSVVALFAASCKKDDAPANITPTVQNLTGSYKLSKLTSKTGNSDEVPITDTWFESCQKDDVYKLNADMSYEVVDAGTQCEPSSSETGGQWSLANNTTIIIDDETGTIRKFDGKNLEVSVDYGGTFFIRYYIKQ